MNKEPKLSKRYRGLIQRSIKATRNKRLTVAWDAGREQRRKQTVEEYNKQQMPNKSTGA